MVLDLFPEVDHQQAAPSPQLPRQNELHQWFTPAWAAEAIVEQKFSWLRAGHRVIEPSCGDGAFLCALPQEVEVLGVEIDAALATMAREAAGRRVIAGDFLTLPASELGTADAIVGNPPFSSELVAAFLDRSVQLLKEGGEAGFILPAYILQTSSKVEALSQHYSLEQELLPRNLFPRLKLPLCFVKFVKDRRRRLHGFLLYHEAAEISRIDKAWRHVLATTRSRTGVWYPLVRGCLAALGGEADLAAIYRAIEGRRPTGNPAWKEKVRQVLQNARRFSRTGSGRYRLAEPIPV
ncbi:class I SAM-dependent methyltransferase [Ramlibacter sp. AN1133]|uniref:class I SAM-dependent methyltransferase n=1 Tax=Ramlibacter sp. AN1133 TaxID=3133429 RepID=UPI0030BB3147